MNPFTLHLQLLTTDLDTWTIALIDSGADCNVLSYETWEKLGKPELIPSTLTFDNFSGSKTLSLGKLCVKALVQEQPMHIVFQIAHEGQATINVVLGRQWIAAHNFQINWTTRGYTLHVNSINLRGKSSKLENLTSQQGVLSSKSPALNVPSSLQSSYVWVQDVDNPTHGWKASKSLLHSQGYGRGERQNSQCWLPRSSYSHLPNAMIHQNSQQFHQQTRTNKLMWVPKSQKNHPPKKPSHGLKSDYKRSINSRTNNMNKQIWIPKAIIKAQWDGKSTFQIWVPKHSLTPTNNSKSIQTCTNIVSTKRVILHAQNSTLPVKSTLKWAPKQQLQKERVQTLANKTCSRA